MPGLFKAITLLSFILGQQVVADLCFIVGGAILDEAGADYTSWSLYHLLHVLSDTAPKLIPVFISCKTLRHRIVIGFSQLILLYHHIAGN